MINLIYWWLIEGIWLIVVDPLKNSGPSPAKLRNNITHLAIWRSDAGWWRNYGTGTNARTILCPVALYPVNPFEQLTSDMQKQIRPGKMTLLKVPELWRENKIYRGIHLQLFLAELCCISKMQPRRTWVHDEVWSCGWQNGMKVWNICSLAFPRNLSHDTLHGCFKETSPQRAQPLRALQEVGRTHWLMSKVVSISAVLR